MRDISLTILERECWRLRANSRNYRKIGAALGISGERAQYETYGAAAKLIRRWRKRRRRSEENNDDRKRD